jgi:hypothetical protein
VPVDSVPVEQGVQAPVVRTGQLRQALVASAAMELELVWELQPPLAELERVSVVRAAAQERDLQLQPAAMEWVPVV